MIYIHLDIDIDINLHIYVHASIHMYYLCEKRDVYYIISSNV